MEEGKAVNGIVLRDISAEVFGKYQYCTMYDGLWYADCDFENGWGGGKPKEGAQPNPLRHPNAPPFRSKLSEKVASKLTTDRIMDVLVIALMIAALCLLVIIMIGLITDFPILSKDT